jgi:chitin disaccharide deacetylase
MRIVVNADDFGLSQDSVRATIAAIRAGYVTSATLMPNVPCSAEAIAFARTMPGVSFGVHLTFGGEGSEKSVASPADLPALVDSEGRLSQSTNRVRLNAILGRLPVPQLELEIAAQVNLIRDQGIEISHVDSHQHLHKYKPFREALARVLPKLGLRRVRNVQDVYLRRPRMSLTALFGNRWRTDLMMRFATTDHFYMPASAGETSWTALLRYPELQNSTIEVGVHPGETEPWRQLEAEGAADFAREAKNGGHRLITWLEI